jgi:hypothetical protein
MKWKRALIGCGAVLLLAAAGGLVFLKITITQDFSSPNLAKFRSPAIVGDEVWLLEEGFVDRGLSVFVVCSKHGKAPIEVTSLDWDGQYYFSSFQWTNDGKVAVFTVEGPVVPKAPTLAYDFEQGKAILPSWQDGRSMNLVTSDKWTAFQQIVATLIDSHGGLQSEAIGRETIRNQSERIWYWEIPKR